MSRIFRSVPQRAPHVVLTLALVVAFAAPLVAEDAPASQPSGPEADVLAFMAAHDAEMLYDVKVDSIRDAAIWTALKERLPAEDRRTLFDTLKSAAQTQIDLEVVEILYGNPALRPIVDGIVRVSGGGTSEAHGLARITFAQPVDGWWDVFDQITSGIRVAGLGGFHKTRLAGFPAYVYEKGEAAPHDDFTLALVRYRDDVVLAGSTSLVTAFLDALAQDAPLPTDNALFDRARTDAPYSVLVASSIASPPAVSAFPNGGDAAMPAMLQTPLPISTLKGGRILVNVTDRIELTATYNFGSPEQAAQFKGMLDGLFSLLGMMVAQTPDLAAITEGLRTRIADAKVTLSMTFTADMIVAAARTFLLEAQPPETPALVQSTADLRAIYAAVLMHALDHDGACPAALDDLRDDLPDADVLWSPLARPRASDEARATSYVLSPDLAGKPLPAGAQADREPLVWLDPALATTEAVPVLYANGRVRVVTLAPGAEAVSTFRAAASDSTPQP